MGGAHSIGENVLSYKIIKIPYRKMLQFKSQHHDDVIFYYGPHQKERICYQNKRRFTEFHFVDETVAEIIKHTNNGNLIVIL